MQRGFPSRPSEPRRARIVVYVVAVTWLGAFALAGASCKRDQHGRVTVSQGECLTCHQAEYASATSPPHEGRFPTTCGGCHTEEAWVPAQAIDHEWFPLNNRHATEPCTSCHTVGFAPGDTPRECVGCHRDDYEMTAAPPHPSSGISENCAMCHTDAGWRPSTFEHPWPLGGAHARTGCPQCHGDPPTYRGTPTVCVDCHRADYEGATMPLHAGGGISTECASCHNDVSWRPSTFDHPWPLDGAHARTNCGSCHGDPPTYAGTPTVCVDCHRADYESSPYPGHSTFPTTCADCHTTDGWSPAMGGGVHPEARFPITRGAHRGIACLDCHDTSLGSAVGGANTDCVGCHRNEDGEHRGVSRYPLGPDRSPHFCLDCHPSGRE